MKVLFFLLTPFFLACLTQADSYTAEVSKLDRYLNKAAANGYAGSVLVSVQGKIILSNGYGLADREEQLKFAPDTIFDIGSITKQFTAACVLKLDAQKKLNVQDPITKYFEGVPEDKKSITLHHLLTHTAGLPGSVGSDEELIGREEYLKRVFSTPLIHVPGAYDYSNVGYSLLAAVVEKVTGKDYEEYLRQEILLPAGMKQTGYVLPAWDKQKMAIGYRNQERWGTTYDMSQYEKGVTWHLRGNGGIHSTVGDMHLWSDALKGNSILPDSAKHKYFAPHVRIQRDNDSEFYGYGWRITKNDKNQKIIEHNGGNGFFMATFRMVPEMDYNIVVSTNDAGKNTDAIATRLERILFENLQELDDSFMKEFSGKYVLPSGAAFPVKFNENDEAVLTLDQPETWQAFGGMDEDDPKKAQHFDQKTEELLKAFYGANLDQAIALSGWSREEVSEMITGFRDRLEKKYGRCKEPEVVGSVSRRNGDFHITLVDLNCEKDHHRTVIWQEERLYDFRPIDDRNTKPFEHTKGNEFFAESNNRSIRFDRQNGKAVLILRSRGKDIVAQKQ